MQIKALKCLKCEDTIYSRARHDFHYCSCGECFVDGGFDYMRYGGDFDKIKLVNIRVKTTKLELYQDWNYRRDKFGVRHGRKSK